MSESIHGHRVMELMAVAEKPFTKAELIKAVHAQFGTDARFHTCSAQDMDAAALIDFLQTRGKFLITAEGIALRPDSICDHE